MADAKIQGSALHDAVLAGELELHHQRPYENLQGRHGQHRISPEGDRPQPPLAASGGGSNIAAS